MQRHRQRASGDAGVRRCSMADEEGSTHHPSPNPPIGTGHRPLGLHDEERAIRRETTTSITPIEATANPPVIGARLTASSRRRAERVAATPRRARPELRPRRDAELDAEWS